MRRDGDSPLRMYSFCCQVKVAIQLQVRYYVCKLSYSYDTQLLPFAFRDERKKSTKVNNFCPSICMNMFLCMCSIVGVPCCSEGFFSFDASLFWCTHCLLAASNSCTLPSFSSSHGSVLTQMAFKAPVLLVLKKFALSGSLSLAQTLG